jgi:hypothetical protein
MTHKSATTPRTDAVLSSDHYAKDLLELARTLERELAALREGVPRDAARLHDYPRLLAFFDKYALGPKSKPSCLVCGRDDYDAPPAIQHLELPGIVVCLKCRDAAQEGTP